MQPTVNDRSSFMPFTTPPPPPLVCSRLLTNTKWPLPAAIIGTKRFWQPCEFNYFVVNHFYPGKVQCVWQKNAVRVWSRVAFLPINASFYCLHRRPIKRESISRFLCALKSNVSGTKTASSLANNKGHTKHKNEHIKKFN